MAVSMEFTKFTTFLCRFLLGLNNYHVYHYMHTFAMMYKIVKMSYRVN